MPQAESLQTEIVIVDKASKAFDEIERSAERATLATDRNLESVGALEHGFIDLAAKAGPAIYAVEEAMRLLQGTAEKAIQAIGRGDDIAKTSRALHINAQAFQELDYAIQRGGGSSQDFALGLRTLNRQMAELKKGSSAAQEAFGRLGLSVEDVEKKGLEGTLYAVSDALHNMDDVNAVDDVMQTLLGRGGYKLAAAFSVGSQELDNLREQARKTGTIMQDDALAMSEAGADKLLNATLSIRSVWQNISTAVMPSIVDALERVSQFFTDHQESISKIERLVSRTIGVALDGALAVADTIVGIADALIAPLADFGNALFDQFEIVFSAGGTLKKNNKKESPAELVAIDQRMKIYQAMKEQIDLLRDNADAIDALSEIQKTFNERAKGLFNYQNDLEKRQEEWLKDYQRSHVEDVIGQYLHGGGVFTNENVEYMRSQLYEQTPQGSIFNSKQYSETVSQLSELDKQIANRREDLWNTEAIAKSLPVMSGNRLNAEGSAHAIRNDLNKLEKERASVAGEINLYNSRMNEWLGLIADNTGQTAKNTRRVSINRDDILFMRNIATAQIIYNYNHNTNTANFNQTFGAGSPSQVRKASQDGWGKAMRGTSSAL